MDWSRQRSSAKDQARLGKPYCSRVPATGNPALGSGGNKLRPRLSHRLEQVVALRERKHLGGLASEQFAIGTDFVCLRVDSDFWQRIIPLQIVFLDFSTPAHRFEFFLKTVLLCHPLALQSWLTNAIEQRLLA